MAIVTPPGAARPARVVVSTFWTWLALLVTLVAVAGSLYLSIGMDLIACPLCFYQRTFVMGVAAVLLVGLFAGPGRSGLLSLVTLPLTAAALGVAGFHVYKEYNKDLECPGGAICDLYKQLKKVDKCPEVLQEYDTAPKESAAILLILFLVQTIDVLRSGSRGGFGLVGWLAALIVGGGLAYGAIASAGPGKIPEAPAPLQGCRKPA